MFNLFKKKNSNNPAVITFTGGLGAQMISAAIYFQMQRENQEVYADLSYFNQSKKLAVEGEKGKSSHWEWQLSPFDIEPDLFLNKSHCKSNNPKIISDGPEKLQLALNAFSYNDIKKLFKMQDDVVSHLTDIANSNYLCIHIRRGDYLNVASHLIYDEDFINLSKRLKRVINHVVVVSDSVIKNDFKTSMRNIFPKVSFLDNINEYETHCVMRLAHILVCSNSQFSLTAGLLNDEGFVILPRVWFGKEHPDIEAIVGNLGGFQVLR